MRRRRILFGLLVPLLFCRCDLFDLGGGNDKDPPPATNDPPIFGELRSRDLLSPRALTMIEEGDGIFQHALAPYYGVLGNDPLFRILEIYADYELFPYNYPEDAGTTFDERMKTFYLNADNIANIYSLFVTQNSDAETSQLSGRAAANRMVFEIGASDFRVGQS